MFKIIEGGVCAPQGFSANGIHCGIRKNRTKRDIALIISDVPAAAAATYTTNLVKGAPLTVTKNNIANGYAQAVICNSGNANTCNANGIEVAEEMCKLVEKYTDVKAEDVIVASTGVIGQPLNLEPIANGMKELADGLGNSLDHADYASEAILTTDLVKKEIAVSFTLGGKECKIAGIAKGSGMIHPNMATMLVFITTDAAISPEMLQKALSADIKKTFNMISVDGDTSTNDTLLILANGMAGNEMITCKNEDYYKFMEALNYVNTKMAKMMAGDGEGATALLETKVIHAKTKQDAKILAKSVICSSLTKAAIFGHDANWGRILCALGYSGVNFDPENIELFFQGENGTIQIFKDGVACDYSEEEASKILAEPEVRILVDMKAGEEEACAWGCDLTYDYVKINADYRS